MPRFVTVLFVLLAALGLLACPVSRGGGGGGSDDDDAGGDDDDGAEDDDDVSDDDDEGDDDDDMQPDEDDAGGCDPGYVEDCNDNCWLEENIGDGFCDDGSQYVDDSGCAEFSFDGGDCAGGDDDDTGGCTGHDHCSGDEFCWQGECEFVFNRLYNFEFVSATADQFDENGNNWDYTDAPDLYAVLKIDGTTVLTTSTVETFNASWGEDGDATLTNTSMCFYLYDEGPGTDDQMDVGCYSDQAGLVAAVRYGGYSGELANGLATMTLTITPNF